MVKLLSDRGIQIEVLSFSLLLIIRVKNSELVILFFSFLIFILRSKIRVGVILHITVIKQSYNYILQKNIVEGFKTK